MHAFGVTVCGIGTLFELSQLTGLVFGHSRDAHSKPRLDAPARVK